MHNRSIRILLILALLLVTAAPAQTFAGEYGVPCSQSVKKQSGYSLKSQLLQQAEQTSAKQASGVTGIKLAAATALPESAENTAEADTMPAIETPAPNSGTYEQQIFYLVNRERAEAGLPAFKMNTRLSGVAENKAEDLRDKHYFSHQSPTYGSPFDMMKQFGISYQSAGENLAKGHKSPEAVMNAWMNSAGHRANILNPDFTEIGIGYVTDSNGVTYWVQMFISP